VEKLVRKFRASDDDAVKTVQRRVRGILRYGAWAIPREDQRDLEQKAMWQLWEAVQNESFRPGGFWKFVEIVVARRCVDWRRTRRDERAVDEIEEPRDESANPLKRAIQKEKLLLARDILMNLPQECRELIQLHAGEQKSYREISKILGVKESALRVRMHRCIQRARGVLEKSTRPERK
jgi:RNA polymerase sigma factor (sigma-70 family)